MPNITEFKSPTGETLPIADTTARAEIGVLQQRADDTDHAMADLDNAVKELQQSGTGGGIPTFNLVEIGLPALKPDAQSISVDTTELMDALDKGVVKLHVALDGLGEIDFIGSVFSGFGMYQVIGYYMSGDMNVVIVIVSEGSITAHGTVM